MLNNDTYVSEDPNLSFRSKKRNLSFSSSSPSPQSQIKPKKFLKKMSGTEMSDIDDNATDNEEQMDNKNKLPGNWPHLSQDEKLDQMMEKMLQLDDVTKNVSLLVDEKEENKQLKLKVAALEGRNIRLENELSQMKKKVEELQWRGMRNNVLFYNVKEDENENCETKVIEFLTNKLIISDDLIYTKSNLAGEVRVDVAHRIGANNPQRNSPRPIVANFVTRKGKEIVLSNAPKLKGTDFSISEQLPSGMRERRLAQIETMNELRSNLKNKKTHNIRMVKDKLYMNKDIVKPGFKFNPLPDVVESPISYDNLHHSNEITVSGSIFQGHSLKINNIEDATKAKSALLQNPCVAQAHHIMYAYKFEGKNGSLVRGNDDDGEYTGSKYLTEILNNPDVNNVFLAVSRVHNGPNLGRQRFELIQASGEHALNLID